MRIKTRYRHMTPMAAQAVRDLYFVGRLRQWQIAKMFGLTQQGVARIVSGKSWSLSA